MMLSCSRSAALLLYLISTCHATPTYSYPLTSQLPPLIVYGESYSYQLSSDTFVSSDNTQIAFTADNLPTWLAFDSATRTLSGTAPSSSGSNNNVTFELTGTDSSGSLSVNSTLAISDIDIATLSSSFSLASTLQKQGELADSNTLILTPSENFSIELSSNAFNASSDNPITEYSSLTSSHTPLPIWITFDSSTLTFSGQAPAVNSEIAPSITYSFSLFAIQVSGFSSASLDFNIEVGAHQFSTNITSYNETVTPGTAFEYLLPLDDMFLDDEPIATSNITDISTTSSWLTADLSQGTIKGNVPEDFQETSYTVTVVDSYNDTVDFLLRLSINSTSNSTNSTYTSDPIFTESSLDSINATIGNYFSYTLPSSAVNSTDANITVTSDPTASWLTFNQSNLTLSGTVPNSFSGTKITLTDEDNSSDKLEFTVRAVEASASSSPSSTASSTTSSAASSGTSSSKGISKNTKIAIACGVVIPFVVVPAIVLLLFFCCRRQKKVKGPISSPILPEGEINSNTRRIVEKPPAIFTTAYDSGSAERIDITPAFSETFEKGFESPGRATEINMYKLNNPSKGYLDFQASPISFFSEGESESTHVDNNRLEGIQRNILGDLEGSPSASDPSSAVAASSALGAAIAISSKTSFPTLDMPVIPPKAAQRGDFNFSEPQGKAQNSWRQAHETEERWHARGQGGSMATINSDELPSMRMVGSGVRTVQPSREVSSPIIQHLSGFSDCTDSSHYPEGGEHSRDNSKSSSIGSYSSSDSENTQQRYGPAVPYSNASNLGAIVESPHLGGTSSKHTEETKASMESVDDLNEIYRTASSGDEYLDVESSDDDGERIRPRLNSRGEWEWEKVSGTNPPIVFGQAIDYRSSSNYSLDGDVGTITSAVGSTSTAVPPLNRKSSTKLVPFNKERSTSLSNSVRNVRDSDNKLSGNYQSVAAELSFI